MYFLFVICALNDECLNPSSDLGNSRISNETYNGDSLFSKFFVDILIPLPSSLLQSVLFTINKLLSNYPEHQKVFFNSTKSLHV